MKTRTFSAGLALFMALFLITGMSEEGFSQGNYNPGDVVSDFTLLDLEGNQVSLSDYEGYVIFINFFGYS